MTDFDSELPVRSSLPGQVLPDDIIVKLGDATNPTTQQATVDANGSQATVIKDTAGNAVTTQANGSQRALDIGIDVAGVQIDPRVIRALTAADVVTAQQGTSPWISKDQADGPVAPGAVAAFSQLAGGQFNSAPPTLTNTQQVALQVDVNGRLLVDANTVSTDDHNFGTVGANTLRTAAQIGNATGAADFNNGATGAQTLRVAANLSIGGGNVTAANPVPVVFEPSPGSHVNDYKDAAAIGANASDNHDYTVTAGKTLHLNQIESSASGKLKMLVQVETGVATGVFTTYWNQFNSTANPNCQIKIQNDISVAAGVRVRLVMTNKDNQSQDLYSTISGYEV